MMANYMTSTQTIIMEALSSLPPSHLSHLSHSIAALSRRHLTRLVSLLSSPTLFSLALRHLQSLSLHKKSLLIARHLLSNLALLNHSMQNNPARTATISICSTKLRDLDAVLLLLLLCELHQHDPGFLDTPASRWRGGGGGGAAPRGGGGGGGARAASAARAVLTLSGSLGGCSDGEALARFVDGVCRCLNLVNVMAAAAPEPAAATAAAVVGLPAVEAGGGEECVICREEMEKGRDVCELPCKHLFHWGCILRWLKKRSTCPCCRRRLPTDDLRREIERLLEEIALIGGGGLHRECL